MKRLISAVALVLLTASPLPAAEPPPASKLSVFTTQGLALRSRHGVAIPRGETTIYLRYIAAHHSKSEFSYVAWRTADGTWTVSHVGEVTSYVPPPPGAAPRGTEFIAEKTRVLGPKDAALLDTLMASEKLGVMPRPGPSGVGAPQIFLEIITPARRAYVDWMGEPSGEVRQIADIILDFPR